ncbi:hypothetical protein MMYC01_200615 [Madurella mycetomatis]|uniref:EKC/KEOPS complex subunit CGI121 n=1 Tax=Madurella mycetomatis TaxID=100816 RepID=A0A175WGH9_9PEZI|nr:hypothetical protein MMYC01_200615 [Madurella mycetomatis]
MALERLNLEHVPPEYRVYAAFFRDVANTDFLHAQLLSRNGDFEYAFVDASSVASRLHLLTAIYNALNILIDGTLRTPNVHSEIVVSLSTNNNIADAYRRWGITPGKTKDLIVVKVVSPLSAPEARAQTPDSIWAHLTKHIKGTPTPFTDPELSHATDWPKVRRYYRLNGVPALEKLDNEEERRRQMERLAIMGMALRGL